MVYTTRGVVRGDDPSIDRTIERGGERATGGRVNIDIDIDIAGGSEREW